MKKILIYLFTFLLAISFTGCATWEGMQEDSEDAWEATKEVSSDAWEGTKEIVGAE